MGLTKDYRLQFFDFLREASQRRLTSKNMSFGQISRQAGFASRNYAREIIKGHKFPSLEALNMLLNGLGLPYTEKQICRLLHQQAHQNQPLSGRFLQQLKRLQLSLQLEVQQHAIPPPFSKHYLPVILAAVGSHEQGSTFETIVQRSGYNRESVRVAIAHLHELGLIVIKKNHYYLKESHLIFESLGGSEAFKDFYLANLDVCRRQAKKNFRSKQHLFLNSTFTIPKDSMEKLREILKQTLFEFIDSHECPTGTEIAHLSVGFFGNNH